MAEGISLSSQGQGQTSQGFITEVNLAFINTSYSPFWQKKKKLKAKVSLVEKYIWQKRKEKKQNGEDD